MKSFLAALAAIVTITIHSPAHAVLIGCWTGDGNAFDSSGNANHGTLTNGATYGTGMANQGFSLDGSDDYVALPNATSNLVSNTAGTIAGWVNPSNVGNNDIIAAFGSGGDGQGIGLGIFGPAGGIRVYHHVHDWQTTTPVTPNTWTHIAYTWDATSETIYVNGAFNVSRPRGTFSYVPGQARIGHGFWGDPANNFPGLIDEVRVYDNALTAGEVAGLVPEPSASLLFIGTSVLWVAFGRFKCGRQLRWKGTAR